MQSTDNFVKMGKWLEGEQSVVEREGESDESGNPFQTVGAL